MCKNGVNVFDSFVRKNKEKKTLLFPINTPGGEEGGGKPNHWTLLVLNQDSNEWTHFNSLLPRFGGENVYVEDAKKVVCLY